MRFIRPMPLAPEALCFPHPTLVSFGSDLVLVGDLVRGEARILP
jgi:hypothetical protein